MKKSLIGLGIALAVVAGCLLSLVAGALAGGAIAYLTARPSREALLPQLWREFVPEPGPWQEEPQPEPGPWQQEPQPEPQVPEPWQMPPSEMLQPFAWQLNAALISQVDPGDPADEAGVKEGDIVLAVDGKALDERHDLATLILGYEPGDDVILTVLRPDDETEITEIAVTLGRDRDEEGEVVAHLGVAYRTLSGGLGLIAPGNNRSWD